MKENQITFQHRNRANHHGAFQLLNKQDGYILPFVLILLIALLVGSASFFYRSSNSTNLSGASRDYDQARLLAESGANYVLGRFTNISTTTYTLTCPAASMVGDLNCDGSLDNGQAKPASLNPTLPLALGYQFFMTSGTGITQNAANSLQIVADGEARGTGAALSNQSISTATTYLRVNDLFVSSSIRPRLFTQSQAGLAPSPNTWNAETSPEKVAVWLEVTRNPENPNWFDLYINSAAQVGNAKAYLQRYMGSYTDLLGNAVIAPLSESANHS